MSSSGTWGNTKKRATCRAGQPPTQTKQKSSAQLSAGLRPLSHAIASSSLFLVCVVGGVSLDPGPQVLSSSGVSCAVDDDGFFLFFAQPPLAWAWIDAVIG